MTDYLNSSPALAGAGVKASEGVFPFFPQKKEKSKEAEYFIYGFSFLITERQKRSGKKCYSQAKNDLNRFPQ